jgi:L-asparagine transporter-like permease
MTFRTEYWLSSLKVATIVVFILLGILVNVGANRDHHFIGFENWNIPGAPFVGGFGGFVRVFVTASFACKPFHINICRQSNNTSSWLRWRDREPRHHCWRNRESG